MESYRKRAFLCLVLTFFIVFVCLCPNSSPCGILEKRGACLPHTQIANSTDALCATQFTQQTPFTRYLPSTPLIRFSCVCVIMYVFMCVCVCVFVCVCVCVFGKGRPRRCATAFTQQLASSLAWLHIYTDLFPSSSKSSSPALFRRQDFVQAQSELISPFLGTSNTTRACFC